MPHDTVAVHALSVTTTTSLLAEWLFGTDIASVELHESSSKHACVNVVQHASGGGLLLWFLSLIAGSDSDHSARENLMIPPLQQG